MTDPPAAKTLTFRCPSGLDGLIPRPIAAARGIPAWLREMPGEAFSGVAQANEDTVKRCPPFVDAMTQGFLIPLICDLKVDKGEFTWDSELPPSAGPAAPRAPIGFHDPAQVTGTPLFEADRFVVKFHNLWTIEAPEGYAIFFTHPVNRFDLPFTTLTGFVDSDRYHDVWIHFPAVWRDPDFSGILPAGTPIAQCFPVKRETWAAREAVLTEDDIGRARDLTQAITREKGVYRRLFRA